MAWISPDLLGRLEATRTNAHRLYSSPHLWVERFGADLLVSHQTPELDAAFAEEMDVWCRNQQLPITRIFSKHLPKQNADRVAPILFRGDPTLPIRTTVQERGLHFEIDFEAGYSCGLFIDQRANRAFLQEAAPERVLNCFAYTCAFSIAAAAVGGSTVSVDLSKKSLDRGKQNFKLNELSPEDHQFIADDVLEYLPRLSRRNQKFDAIILDPPTFSRGHKGRRWQVEEGLSSLLLNALEVAGREALILLSTNCARLKRRDLELIARPMVKAARRSCSFHAEPPPPDFPESAVPRTLWLLLN